MFDFQNKIFLKLNYFLSGFKNKFLILSILIIINSILEILSIGIFIPALNLFIKNNNLYLFNNFTFNQSLFIFFILIVTLFIFKFFFFLYLLLFQNKLLKNLNIFFNKKLIFLLLKKPMRYFFDKNSSENINLVKNVDAINLVLSHSVMILIDLFTAFLIILFMSIYEPLITLIILILIIVSSSIYYFYSKNKLEIIGRTRFDSSRRILNNLREIFNGIKEIKIYRAYNYFSENFIKNQSKFIDANNKEKIILSLPRAFFEVMMIVFFGIIILIFLQKNYVLDDVIIKLGIFILVTIKILPTINRLLSNLQSIKSHMYSFNKVYEILNFEKEEDILINKKDLRFKSKIEFLNVDFRYPNSNFKIFENINLNINKGDKIGIFGESGSGKSTLVDLVCGFSRPTAGKIIVDDDNETIFSNEWLNLISYLPQKIFLSDNSIKFNIAYGQDEKNQDINKLNFIFKNETILNFLNDLSENEKTIIGEDGLKISGGQRQRIGVARAVYKSSDIIILDEATSALDEESEKKLLDFLFLYFREKTLILISHKQENLSRCNTIFHLIDRKLKVVKNKK